MSHFRAPSRETAAAVPGPGLDQAASFVRELYGQDISLRAGSQDNHPRFRFAETDMLDRVDEFAIANRARVLRSRELRRLFIAAVAWTDKAVAEAVANAVGAVRAWNARNAAFRDLSRLNDHLLKDIGIDRSEIRAVVNGMLSRPPARKDRSSLALHVVAAADPAQQAAKDNDLASAA